MAEDSFNEVVRFVWNVESPDAGARSMLESIGKIDKSLLDLDARSATVFRNFGGVNMTPAIEGVDLLAAHLNAVLAKINQINETPIRTNVGAGADRPMGPDVPGLVQTSPGVYQPRGPGGHFGTPVAPAGAGGGGIDDPGTPAGWLTYGPNKSGSGGQSSWDPSSWQKMPIQGGTLPYWEEMRSTATGPLYGSPGLMPPQLSGVSSFLPVQFGQSYLGNGNYGGGTQLPLGGLGSPFGFPAPYQDINLGRPLQQASFPFTDRTNALGMSTGVLSSGGFTEVGVQAEAEFRMLRDKADLMAQIDEETNANQIASMQRRQMQFGMQSVTQQYQEQQAGPMDLTGLTGPGLTMGLQQNLAAARKEAAGLFAEVKSGNADAIPSFNAAAQNVKSLETELASTNETASVLERTFTRILTRIIIYTAIFEAFRLLTGVIKDMTDQMLRLDDVSTRVGFINGQGIGATQSQFLQAGSYGITPAQAGPGIITAGQLGSSPDQQKQAAQLALVFGTDKYNDALIQLNRTQAQADAIGLKNVQTMDFLAQSYKTAPGTLDDYFTALNKGIEMHAQFGTSAVAMGLAIEQANKDTGSSVQDVGTMIQAVLSKLQLPATTQALAGWGITSKPGDTAGTIRQISDAIQQMSAAGDSAGIQQLSELLSGNIGGFSRVQNLPALFRDLAVAIDNTDPSLTKFGDLLNGVSNTGQVKINELKASWQDFLMALGSGGAGDATKSLLDAATATLQAHSIPGDQKSAFNNLSQQRQQDLIGQYQAQTGYDVSRPGPGSVGSLIEQEAGLILGLVGKQVRLDVTNNPEFMAWFQNNPSGVTSTDARSAAIAEHRDLGVRGTYTQPGPTFPFGGIDATPQGITFQDFTKSVRSFEDQLVKQGAPLGADGKTLADTATHLFYDKTTHIWEHIDASNNAIMLATQQIASASNGFGGIGQPGMDYVKLQARINQLEPAVAAAGLDTTQKTQEIWDPVTGTLKEIRGSSAATAIATQEAAKLLQQQITGVFNVPAGGEAMVAFFALTQGFGPSTLNGASGGSLNGSANALNTSASSLQLAANLWIAGARGLLSMSMGATAQTVPASGASGISSYIGAHTGVSHAVSGGPLQGHQLQIPSGSSSAGAQGTLDYIRAHQPYQVPLVPPANRVPGGQSSPTQLSFNNNIKVEIDGKQVAYYMNRKTYRQFDSVRNSASGANQAVSI